MKNADEFRNTQETSANTFLPAPEIHNIQPSRRELLRAAGVAGAATIAGAFALKGPVAMAQSSSSSPSSSTSAVNPFKDPSYAEGARQRMQQFIGGGADPEATRSVSENSSSLLLNSLEKECRCVRIIGNHGETVPNLPSRTRFAVTSEPARLVAG
jgi:hypothetical protein